MPRPRLLHPVSITRFPLRRFSPGAGLLRNPFFHRWRLRFSRGWVRKDGNLLTETTTSSALQEGCAKGLRRRAHKHLYIYIYVYIYIYICTNSNNTTNNTSSHINIQSYSGTGPAFPFSDASQLTPRPHT